MQFAHVRDSVKANGKVAYLADADVEQAQYHMLFPNCTINIDPGPGNMSVDVDAAGRPGPLRRLDRVLLLRGGLRRDRRKR